MHRKVRVRNPDCRAVAIDWSIHLSEPGKLKNGVREGELEMSFRSRDKQGRKILFSFPCVVSADRCFVRKTGTVKRHSQDGRVSEKAFSVADRMVKEPKNKFLHIFNDVVEAVARNCGEMLASIRGAVSLDGTSLLSPKLMGIPKMVTVREISLEELRKNGQI